MGFTATGGVNRSRRRGGRAAVVAALVTGLTLSATPAYAGSAEDWKIIAHRGGVVDRALGVPEHTYAAFDFMLASGTDAVELDILFTEDNVPVVFHDETGRRILRGPSFCSRAIADLDLDQLERCDAGSWIDPKWKAEQVPTMRGALEYLDKRTGSGFQFFLHIKTVSRKNANKIAKVVENIGLTDQVVVIAGSTTMLRHLKDKGLKKQGLVAGVNVFRQKTRYKFLIPYNVTLNSSVIKAAHKRGQKVTPVQNHPYSLAQLDQFDIDGVLSDNLPETLAVAGRGGQSRVSTARVAPVDTDGPLRSTGPQDF
ncbi:MAG: glycerophosphodiester phosphodiesterase [Sporichthyaceae bacterium]